MFVARELEGKRVVARRSVLHQHAPKVPELFHKQHENHQEMPKYTRNAKRIVFQAYGSCFLNVASAPPPFALSIHTHNVFICMQEGGFAPYTWLSEAETKALS